PSEFIRDLDRHLGVAASVVSDHQGKLLAIDATAFVDVAHRQLSASPQLFTEHRVMRGHWGDAQRTGNGNPDFSSCNIGCAHSHNGNNGRADERPAEWCWKVHHPSLFDATCRLLLVLEPL